MAAYHPNITGPQHFHLEDEDVEVAAMLRPAYRVPVMIVQAVTEHGGGERQSMDDAAAMPLLSADCRSKRSRRRQRRAGCRLVEEAPAMLEPSARS